MSGALVSAAGAKALDVEASAHWGLNPFALVEAAGRACAHAFCAAYAWRQNEKHAIAVFTGKGNNTADALVMLKALILDGYAQAADCVVFTPIAKEAEIKDKTVLVEAMYAVQKLNVPLVEWEAKAKADADVREAIITDLARYDVIIDGITGTGLNGPLRDIALEMTEAVNSVATTATAASAQPRMISIDVPSGNFDGWQTGMPIITAHATLAIEPYKRCLYTPAARLYAGDIIPVGGIFPPALLKKHREAELHDWESAAARIAPVARTAYKHQRGVVEIRAGSVGAAGAARLAAVGAQSAGAGLVRLIVDASLYPVIAPACSGVMVAIETDERFTPNAVLLGPGWGRGEDRLSLLKHYLPMEKSGVPLILDADAIALAQGMTFNGNALLTPHPGEFAAYTGLAKDAILNDPIPALRRCAAERNAHILLKGHVLYVAAPDGRIGIIDGMNPALATGGTGDILAGFCAAIAARSAATQQPFDGYACACAAATLLMKAAQAQGVAGVCIDPAELAHPAAAIAGAAWLPAAYMPQEVL